MSELITLQLILRGKFPESTTVNWVMHRARLLNMCGGLTFQNTTCLELVVTGERVLVEAFEVACSLGPFDAIVESITRQELPTPQSFYRQPGQFVRYSLPCHSEQTTTQ